MMISSLKSLGIQGRKKILALLTDHPLFWGMVVVFSAGIFRFSFLNLIEFKLDEAITIFEISRFFTKPYLINHSFSPLSVGLYYVPFATYVLIFFAMFSRHPMILSLIIALFNVLGIAFFYFWARRYYGQLAALVAALILSFSPWGILFSRKIWTPDLLLPFSVFFLYFLHRLIIDKDIKASGWLLFSAALLAQTHPPGIYLVLASIAVVLILKVKFDSKKAVLGLAVGLLPSLPYFLSALRCFSCLRVETPLSHAPGVFDFRNLILPWQFISGLGFIETLGQSFSVFLESYPFLGFFEFFFWVLMVFPLLGIWFIFSNRKNFRFVALLPLVYPLFFLLTKTAARTYYYIPISPLVALLWGMTVKEIGRTVGIVAVILLLVMNVIFEVSFIAFLSKKQAIMGDYGPVFEKTEKEVSRLVENYTSLNFFEELKNYAYILYWQPNFHEKLGEYLAQKEEPYLAIEEYKKAIKTNKKDVAARANLIYINIIVGDFEAAQRGLEELDDYDATVSADLRRILKQAEDKSTKIFRR